MLNLTRLHLGIAHESQFQGLGITTRKQGNCAGGDFVQPQVGSSIGPSHRRPGRAQREPGPITTGGDHGSPAFAGTTGWRNGPRLRINHTHSIVPPAYFCPRGFASLLHSPRIEGWAARRETFGSSAEHPLALHM